MKSLELIIMAGKSMRVYDGGAGADALAWLQEAP